MNYKGLVLAILIITMLLCGTLVSCGSTSSGGGVSEFEVIRQAADAYLSSGKADGTILGKDLYAILTDGNKGNDPYIMSIRRNTQYQLGHICGAIRFNWRGFFMDEWFNKLPTKDQKIVVYDYNGHNGGKCAAILNMMGWDVINLQWGFTCIMLCPNTAPGIFRSAIDGGVGQDYATEKTENKPTKEYPFPVVENTGSEDPLEIIRTAADAWNRNVVYSPQMFKTLQIEDIEANDLHGLLIDGDTSNDPFILDVREPEWYAKGHIAGAINIPITEVAKPENLRKLPPNRLIVVVSNDGHAGAQVMAILNILSYNANNLYFGMTSWTRDLNIAPGRFEEKYPGTQTYKDILDVPFCWGDEPGSY
jgi:rhodanese-related sulfurtransferase